MMRAKLDLTGKRFGKVVVLSRAEVLVGTRVRLYWTCRCDCGNVRNFRSDVLHEAKTCGCAATIHGNCKHPLYQLWSAMKHRCEKPQHKFYNLYGGRGIAVCERWQTFENFIADMGPRPDGTELDRIDNDKGYSPDNCRWTTHKENIRNRGYTKLLTFEGETLPVVVWAERTGLDRYLIYGRMKKGWEAKKVLAPKFQTKYV